VKVRDIFAASDADATRALYAALERRGPVGAIAMNLLRAQKASDRAKVYRGRRFVDAAYDKKAWSMAQLAAALAAAPAWMFLWGWKLDPLPPPMIPWVLYVDLPTGQVSFHARARGLGPDYAREWDGSRGQSADRIIAWAQDVLAREPVPDTEATT
jgi:hypothetical protein